VTRNAIPPEQTGGRRALRGEAARLAILEAAQSCFARYGFFKTTILDIAAQAKVTRRTVYRYYPTKEDILAAVEEEVSARLSVELVDLALRQAPAGARVADMVVHAHRRLSGLPWAFGRTPCCVQLASVPGADHAALAAMRRQWGEALARLRADGAIADDIDDRAVLNWLLVVDAALATLFAMPGATGEQVRELARRVLVVPLLPPSRSNGSAENVDPPAYGARRAITTALDIPGVEAGTYARILSAAFSSFATDGSSATMAEVASGANVDRRTLYRHFPDRAALVEEVTFVEARRVNQQIRRLLQRRADLADSVADSIFLAIRIFAENPFKRQLIEGTEVISAAADHERKIFPYIRGLWFRLLVRLDAEAAGGASAVDLDTMVSWLLIAQHSLHRLIDLEASEDREIYRFIRRFVVDSMVAADRSRNER